MNNFKVVFLGNSCSGKTSLINLFLNKPNPLRTNATNMTGVQKHNIQIYGQNCEFQFVDPSSFEKYRPILKLFLKSVVPLIAIICYDMHFENEDKDIQYFIDLVRANNENAKIVILGTKQNLGEHENLKNIENQFSNFPFYKVGLNSEEILNQILYCFYDEAIAQQTLIQQELQIVQNRKSILNKSEQNLTKTQKKKSFWGLCSYENDD